MKKQLFLLSLILLLAFSFGGCANPGEPAETPVTTQETEAVLTAQDYLDLAREALLREDHESAISILEQALLEMEDPQLQSLLAELTAPTPLILECSNNAEETVTVHSFTAEESYSHKICYTLDYAAPEGLTVRLWGSHLDSEIPDFVTTGQPGQILFEMDAEDVRNMSGRFQVQFYAPEDQVYTLDARTFWPEQMQTTYEISYLHMDHNRTDNALVHSFLLTDLGDAYHFTVSYTAVEGLAITGLFETPEEKYSFWEEGFYTEGGEGILEFDIEKDLFAQGKYMEVCFTDPSGRWVAAGFDFPMHLRRTLAEPQGEIHHPGYVPSPNGWGGDYEIHDCYYQQLPNGFVRFTLDMTTPAGCFVTISTIGGPEEVMLDQYLSLAGQQQYVFDVPEEQLAQVRSLSVLVAQPFSTGRYLEIPCGAFRTSPSAAPTGDSTALELTVMEKPWNLDCEIIDAQMQSLDNGAFRYHVTVSADEPIRATVFDPPNGENFFLMFLSEPTDGIHTFSFDLEPAAAAALREVTLVANLPENQTFSAVFFNPLAGIPMVSVPITVLSCN